MHIIKSIVFLFILSSTFSQSKYQKDFEYYWQTVQDNFAYFDLQETNWQEVKSIYQPIADTITTDNSFISLLEIINNELYNGHISLNVNLESSNRLIPTGADLWVEYLDGSFKISSVRKDFKADLAGLKKGMQILKFNGVPIDGAIKEFLPRSVPDYNIQMYEYAANMLLAGRHNTKRSITTLFNGIEKTFYPDSILNKTEDDYQRIVEYRIISPDIGYIKINNSLGNVDLIKAFDDALDNLWEAKGLIIDLRETPSGGNTTVARAIMGRFIENEMPYQKHSLPVEEKEFKVKRSWLELVSPRGKIYKMDLIILVNRWTGSMGEGIAIGFDGMK